MIGNYTDHAANERTFLAWVRTSLAVTAFGFLVERFDLGLSRAAPSATNGAHFLYGSQLGHWAGLALIVSGVAMVILAAGRFVQTANEIDDDRVLPGTGTRFHVALTALLALLGIALSLYLFHVMSEPPGGVRGLYAEGGETTVERSDAIVAAQQAIGRQTLLIRQPQKGS